MKAFTLVEVMISFAIISIIFASVTTVFRNFMVQRGVHDNMLRFNNEIQMLEKQIYLDCIRLAPFLDVTESGDIYVRGEQWGQPVPQMIELFDLDGNVENGAEMLRLYTSRLEPVGKTELIEYRFDSAKGELIRKSPQGDHVLAESLKEFHFLPMRKGLKFQGREKRTSEEEEFSTAFSFVDGFARVVWRGEQGR
ncbi:MAG: prepilin-type N-terminal cleavage/methylation domain-containing protein [Candidatus Wallbacteria bacterium]|nr:prepilin-type N-terminal cleavage/methylation domain-containing protein [Candidatus Wallbacteria bacterium]